MTLNGIVTNVTNFGAFVDIGVHQDGLVHKSQIADRFVDNPAEFVKVQQEVTVTVTSVDMHRKRISLSMKSNPFEEKPQKMRSEKKEGKKKQKADGTMEDKLAQLKSRFK